MFGGGCMGCFVQNLLKLMSLVRNADMYIMYIIPLKRLICLLLYISKKIKDRQCTKNTFGVLATKQQYC